MVLITQRYSIVGWGKGDMGGWDETTTLNHPRAEAPSPAAAAVEQTTSSLVWRNPSATAAATATTSTTTTTAKTSMPANGITRRYRLRQMAGGHGGLWKNPTSLWRVVLAAAAYFAAMLAFQHYTGLLPGPGVGSSTETWPPPTPAGRVKCLSFFFFFK